MTATPLLAQWVGQYYERGWAVVPLPPRQKSSPPSGLTGRDGVDLTREQLLERLAEDSNIGVRVPDNVIGIDVDAYGEKVGETTLNWLEFGPPGEEDAALGPLPSSYVLTSRDDGVSGIRFFRVPEGREWEQTAGADIDIIRHAHRYAVAAPSIHPEGRQYRWLSPDGVLCGVPKVEDLPELPEAWVRSLQKGARRSSSRSSAAAVTQDEMRATLERFKPGPPCSCVREWGDRALRAARREMGGAHNALLAPVLMLLRQGVGGCTGAGEALHAAWTTYARLDPMHSTDFAVMVSTTIPKAEADPWECADEAVATLAAMKALDPAPAATRVPNPLGYVMWDGRFWNPPPPAYFIPRMLVEGQVGTIYSAGGLGKSLLAQDIVVGLTLRGRVFGIEVERVPVIYIDRENSRRGLGKRLRAMGYHEVDIPLLHYSLLGDWPPLDTREGGLALLSEIERTGARFVVLDTLSKVVDGEENRNDTWRGLHNNTMVAVKNVGCTVLQLDHTGKDTERGQRGGSSKHDNADVVWHLTATDGYVKLINKKDREDDYDPTIYLERRSVPNLEHVLTGALPVEASIEIATAAKVEDIVQMLDELGVPNDAGRPTCVKALREAYGRAPRGIDQAVKQRKARAV
jgi:hypothetical protein